MTQIETYLIESRDAIMASLKAGLFPRRFTVSQNGVDHLKNRYTMLLAVFLEYAQEFPHIMNPPFSNIQKDITELVKRYVDAVNPEEEPLTKEEVTNETEYFTMLVTAFLSYANTTGSEGIMWPPYIYPRPYPENQINRLGEFIEGLSSAFSVALVDAAYPPILPATAGDMAVLNSFFRVYVEPFLTYAHKNSSLMNPPYN